MLILAFEEARSRVVGQPCGAKERHPKNRETLRPRRTMDAGRRLIAWLPGVITGLP